MDFSVEELQRVSCGQLQWATMPPRGGELTTLKRVVVDSRQADSGDLFWALRGRQHHGADFANDAYAQGAIGVVTDRPVAPLPGCFCLRVDNTQLALWNLAAWHREHFSGTLVGVTGSVGKTTAREMIRTVLGATLRGLAAQRNLNNHLGVPLSLLRLEPNHDFAVLEYGASGPGEIDALARLSQPEIGVITCLADAHLGGFGSHEELIRAKFELINALPAGAAAIVPDGQQTRVGAQRPDLEVVVFGRSTDCDIVPERVVHEDGRLRFVVCGQDFEIPIWGRHNLEAALAAISVAQLFGRPLAEAAEALRCFESVPQRCQVLRGDGITLINDTYNACPKATKAALALLREFGNSGRRVAVIGDMLELGCEADRLHQEIGQFAVTQCGIDRLVACGQFAQNVTRGARDAGMPHEHIRAYGEPMEAVEHLNNLLEKGDVVLAKGSRAMQMERVVSAITQPAPARVA